MAGSKEKPDLVRESAVKRTGFNSEEFFKGNVILRDRRTGDAIAPTGR